MFSGDVNVTLPLGPVYPLTPGISWQLKTHYSTRFWSFDNRCPDTNQPNTGHAVVGGYPTLGAGWRLDLGHFQRAFYGGSVRWAYFAPDGGRHVPPTDAGGVPDDGSYLRIKTTSAGYSVEFPDGTVHYFEHAYLRPRAVSDSGSVPSPDFTDRGFGNADIGESHYGLTRVVDRFGTPALSVDYDTSSAQNAWKITRVNLAPGPSGETRAITFNWTTTTSQSSSTNFALNTTWPVLSSLSFPTAAGPLTVLFGFWNNPIHRNGYGWESRIAPLCGADISSYPDVTAVPFLSSVSESGVGVSRTWSMTYKAMVDSSEGAEGALSTLTAPTGATISYWYHPNDNFTDSLSCGDPLTLARAAPLVSGAGASRFPYYYQVDNSSGVVTRQQGGPAMPTSAINYERLDFGCQATSGDPQNPSLNLDENRLTRRVIEHRPSGNGTTLAERFFFHIDTAPHGHFSGLLLQHDWLEGDWTGGIVTPVRSEVSCYEDDGAGGGCGFSAGPTTTVSSVTRYPPSGANVRERKHVLWYGAAADGGSTPNGSDCSLDASRPCVQVERTDYNAFAGEYKTVTTSSPSIPGVSPHVETTNWTPQARDGLKWLLKLFDMKSVTDYGSPTWVAAPTSVTRSYTFDPRDGSPVNGFLYSVAMNDAAFGSLTQRYGHDAQWNQTSSTVAGSGSLTGSFTRTRTFQNGLALTDSSTDSAGNPLFAWKQFDVTRDLATGLVTASRDPNQLATQYAFDALGRLIQITPPGSEAPTVITYDESVRPVTVSVKRQGSDDATYEQYSYDGLGRLISEARQMPGFTFSVRRHQYSAADVEMATSEWTSCSAPDCLPSAYTRYSVFDPFGRPTGITQADNKTTSIVRCGVALVNGVCPDGAKYVDFRESVTVNDVSGQPATTTTRKDILGRVIAVAEPYGSSAPPAATTYAYNVFGKLAGVNQPNVSDLSKPSQSRTFTYDGFGLLRSESTPETGTAAQQGTTTYDVYDAQGNVLSETRPGGLVVSRVFDPVGRLRSENAGGCTYLTNRYDESTSLYSAGQLTSRTAFNPDSSCTQGLTIDERSSYAHPAGRLTQKTRSLSGASTLSTSESFDYNSLGMVKNYQHPGNGISETFGYTNGLVTATFGSLGNIVLSASYSPWGALSGYQLFDGTSVTVAPDQDGMPRPHEISATNSSGVSLFDVAYSYDGAGNVRSMGNATQGWDTFAYDVKSRLTSVTLSGVDSRTFSYDDFGNLLSNGVSSFSVDSSRNWLTQATYDVRGSMLMSPGGEVYTWDGLGRNTTYRASPTSGAWKYYYDADGERIARFSPVGGSNWLTLRDPKHRVVVEYLGTTPCRDNFYLGSLLVASYVQPGATCSQIGVSEWSSYVSDHLGTPRVVTAPSTGSTARKYWPFGEEVGTNPISSQRIRFAGMERDTESSRYYDHQRSHDFGLGRFLSPDVLGGQALNPQSWNRYAYARNNPLKFLDPNGLEIRVPKSMEKAVAAGRAGSPEFNRLYTRLDADKRVLVTFDFQARPKPGTRIDSGIVVGGNAEFPGSIRVQERVHVPVGHAGNIPEIGHELTHGEEALDTGKTLKDRAAAGENGIRQNESGYESQNALDHEELIRKEMSSSKPEPVKRDVDPSEEKKEEEER